MKGVIFNLLELFVDQEAGEGAFDEAIDALSLPSGGVFVGPKTYPDTELLALVTYFSEKLNVPAFDLIFMDCHTPITDGYEATRRLKTSLRSASSPGVGLSANSEKTKDLCLNAGMSDFVQKPDNPQALYAMIRRWTPN